MTNWEWLEALANNSPYELQAWFDSEHVQTPNGTSGATITALELEIIELKERLHQGWVCECRLQAERDEARRERETYRELLGKAIDFAFDITLLLDEGAA